MEAPTPASPSQPVRQECPGARWELSRVGSKRARRGSEDYAQAEGMRGRDESIGSMRSFAGSSRLQGGLLGRVLGRGMPQLRSKPPLGRADRRAPSALPNDPASAASSPRRKSPPATSIPRRRLSAGTLARPPSPAANAAPGSLSRAFRLQVRERSAAHRASHS
jgi:hypothetical protein